LLATFLGGSYSLAKEAGTTVEVAMADKKLDGIDDLFATQFGMLVLTDEEVHRGSAPPPLHLHYFVISTRTLHPFHVPDVTSIPTLCIATWKSFILQWSLIM
jgi:hypothetical protein